MRKTLVMACTTGALLFGGAGVANATVPSAPIPTSTTTVADPDNNHHHDSDKTGLWGLAGLIGLLGLVGLKRRNDPSAAAGPGATVGRGRRGWRLASFVKEDEAPVRVFTGLAGTSPLPANRGRPG